MKYFVIALAVVCCGLGYLAGRIIHKTDGIGGGVITVEKHSPPQYITKYVPVTPEEYKACAESKIEITYKLVGNRLDVKAEDKCKATTLSIEQRVECPEKKFDAISAGAGVIAGFLTAAILL